MKQIENDIAEKKFHLYYLLCGEEEYLKLYCKRSLINALVMPGDSMNFNQFYGNPDPDIIREFGATLPFLSEHRVILLEDTGLFKKSSEFDKVFSSFGEDTICIFYEKDVDKRNKLYKFISKNGYVADIQKWTPEQLVPWIQSTAKKAGKKMDKQSAEYLVETVGNDMFQLKNELEKVISYRFNQPDITTADVQSICITQAKEQMFNMLDAIGNRKQGLALSLYHDLLALKEPAMKILFMLQRHYNILLQVSLLGDKSNKEIAAACGIPPFSVKKYQKQAAQFDSGILKSMLEQCNDTDAAIKTGRINNDTIGVELLIVQFSA